MAWFTLSRCSWIYPVWNFCLVSLYNVFLRQVLCEQKQKVRTSGGGLVYPKVTNSMAVSGLSFGNTLVGTGWAISVLLCTKGIRNQSSHLVGPPFTGLNKWLPAKSHDYCKLVKGWVWFELQTCRRWLWGQLYEVWGLKTQHIWGYVW